MPLVFMMREPQALTQCRLGVQGSVEQAHLPAAVWQGSGCSQIARSTNCRGSLGPAGQLYYQALHVQPHCQCDTVPQQPSRGVWALAEWRVALP